MLSPDALPGTVQIGNAAPETREIGDLELECGATIQSVRMSFLTFGTLNGDKSNAILSLHGLKGDRTSQSFLAGPSRPFDTDKYFVIQPDTLGVATLDPHATTSATRSGMNMRFPRYSIRDMICAERKLLDLLGITKLVAVAGTSMGGIEAVQWAVSFPEFMKAVIAIVPQARANRQATLMWEAGRRAIMADCKWQNGDYSPEDTPRDGLAAGVLVQTAFNSSAAACEMQFADREAVHASAMIDMSASIQRLDPRDWIYRTWAIESHDIAQTPGFGGDFAAAAAAIRARLLLFPNSFDQMLPPREGGVFDLFENVPSSRLFDLQDPFGHNGFATDKSLALIRREITSLLESLDPSTAPVTA